MHRSRFEGDLVGGGAGRACMHRVRFCREPIEQPGQPGQLRRGPERARHVVQLRVQQGGADGYSAEIGRIKVFGCGPGREPDHADVGGDPRRGGSSRDHQHHDFGVIDAARQGAEVDVQVTLDVPAGPVWCPVPVRLAPPGAFLSRNASVPARPRLTASQPAYIDRPWSGRSSNAGHGSRSRDGRGDSRTGCVPGGKTRRAISCRAKASASMRLPACGPVLASFRRPVRPGSVPQPASRTVMLATAAAAAIRINGW